jgi:hypothetical protein
MDDFSIASSALPPVPNSVVTEKPVSVSSSCSSTSDECSMISSSTSVSSSGDEMTMYGVAFETVATRTSPDGIQEAPTSGSMASLSLMVDEVRDLARMGHNASLKNKCRLPRDILKSDIHVQVDIDERARAKKATIGQRRTEESIKDAIRDDLQTVYSASAESAKLVLCIVIVLMADGSLVRALWDYDGVAGLAEVGLVWRLFEADDLRVYEGGLVVQSEDVGSSLYDFFRNKGRRCLLDKLVPRAANEIMSQIGDSNEELLVEI